MRYTITRFYANRDPKVLRRNVTLEEAQAHCKDPETSSTTCTSKENHEHTEHFGPWFDGYDKE